jgi:hypothetical protein
MENRIKITYTVPRQIPLFEEKDDGNLTQYHNKKYFLIFYIISLSFSK